jgi:hypothetical protein
MLGLHEDEHLSSNIFLCSIVMSGVECRIYIFLHGTRFNAAATREQLAFDYCLMEP